MNDDIAKNHLDGGIVRKKVDTEFEQKALRAVRAVVIGELEDAYAAFHANPGGSGFGRLESAMYAAQLIAQNFGKEFIMDKLVHVPVAQWLETIEQYLIESGRRI